MLHTFVLLPTHFKLSVLGFCCLVLPLKDFSGYGAADYNDVVGVPMQTGTPVQVKVSCSLGQTAPQAMHKSGI